MNKCICVLAALSVAGFAQQAAAVPTLKRVAATFYQAGNGTLNAGLIVEASTSLPVLILAGGFTITCTTSSLPQNVQNRSTFVDFLGPTATLRIPEVVPSAYPIPGWSGIPAGSCGAQCVMQYSGEAKDETSLSVRVGSTGAGVSFTLIPSGIQSRDNAILIDVCRSGRPQCCTPKCAIP